jgi:hypothetical protein
LFSDPQVASQQVANLFVDTIQRPDDCLSVFSELIGEGDVPEWAKCFFVTSQSFIKLDGGHGSLEIAEKVVPTLSLEQAKEFLEKEFAAPPDELKKWKIAALVFNSFPDSRDELMRVFPQKTRPNITAPKARPILDLIYK